MRKRWEGDESNPKLVTTEISPLFRAVVEIVDKARQ